ncbi:hypothetical protein [Methanobrevibacter olleyae]|nr:hypothetical protein [Methanobrevibacter olleyae]
MSESRKRTFKTILWCFKENLSQRLIWNENRKLNQVHQQSF